MRGFKTAPSLRVWTGKIGFPAKQENLYCILTLLLFTHTCGDYLTSELASERESLLGISPWCCLCTGQAGVWITSNTLHSTFFPFLLLLAVYSSIIHTTQMRARNLSVTMKDSKKATIKKLYPIHQKGCIQFMRCACA